MRLMIFGTGRVGSSIAAYARALGAEVDAVSHTEASAGADALSSRIEAANLVAAAIPDDALPAFAGEFLPALKGRPAIHFSGARIIDGMRSYHPLYSFPKEALPPAVTARIAIAREPGAPAFVSILPGAANPEFIVPAADRPLYHALAVISGNFAAHLFNETAVAFSGRFGGAPPEALAVYFESVVDRFRESPENSMTGPIARRDRATVESNLAALAGEPGLLDLYRAFLSSAWPEAGNR